MNDIDKIKNVALSIKSELKNFLPENQTEHLTCNNIREKIALILSIIDKKELRIEVGKTYRTKGRDKIYIYKPLDGGYLGSLMEGICVVNNGDFFNCCWKSNGLYVRSNGCDKYDIVAEWED